MPLKGRDAAQLLVDLSPRRFKYRELGLNQGSSRKNFMTALESHPVMNALGGHPGTMSRFAPLLNDFYLDNSEIKEMAAK